MAAPKIPHLAPQIIDRYQAGESTYAIARELGVDPKTVYALLVRHGVQTRPRWREVLHDRTAEVVAAYQSGKSLLQVAQEFGVSEAAVQKHLARRDIARRPQVRGCKIPPALHREVADRYASGEAAWSIGAAFGASAMAVLGVVRRCGGAVRSASEARRTCDLDESAFDLVTNESAYWIGFLMGDGCVSRNTCTGQVNITLALSAVDLAQVESFRSFLGSSHKIQLVSVRNPSGSISRRASLAVTSVKIATALAGYGVLPNKTHDAQVVGLEDNIHFWRGVVDSDGSLFVSGQGRPCLSLCGAKPLMAQFSAFVLAATGRRVSVTPTKCIFQVRCNDWLAIEVIKILYAEGAYALPRKAKMAADMICRFRDRYPHPRLQKPQDWQSPVGLSLEQWVGLYRQLGSQAAVAKHLGCSQPNVCRLMRKHGIRLRRS